MALEEGLDKLRATESSTFDRKLQDWGVMPPDVSIGEFLRENKEACGLEEGSRLLGFGDKNFRDYCFELTQARKNHNNDQNNGNNGYKEIDNEEARELYEVLKKYTKDKITEFKEKEKNGTSIEDLKKEKKEILPFVRAREALKDGKVKDYNEAAKEQEIQELKFFKGVTGKAG